MTSKAITTSIKATSKCTIKVRDNFYSVEFSEERSIPENIDESSLEEERRLLWDAVNSTVDEQVADILKMYKK
jgi:hypothetical protein